MEHLALVAWGQQHMRRQGWWGTQRLEGRRGQRGVCVLGARVSVESGGTRAPPGRFTKGTPGFLPPGWGWKPRLGAATHPPHGPSLWTSLLPLAGASHCGRLGHVVSTLSVCGWSRRDRATWKNPERRSKEGDGETGDGRHLAGCQTGNGGDRGRETGPGDSRREDRTGGRWGEGRVELGRREGGRERRVKRGRR